MKSGNVFLKTLTSILIIIIGVPLVMFGVSWFAYQASAQPGAPSQELNVESVTFEELQQQQPTVKDRVIDRVPTQRVPIESRTHTRHSYVPGNRTAVGFDSKYSPQVLSAFQKVKSAKNDEEKSKAVAALRSSLESQYDAYMAKHETNFAQMESRLEKLREQIQKRRDAKQKLVDSQLELLQSSAEGIGWPGVQTVPAEVPGNRSPTPNVKIQNPIRNSDWNDAPFRAADQPGRAAYNAPNPQIFRTKPDPLRRATGNSNGFQAQPQNLNNLTSIRPSRPKQMDFTHPLSRAIKTVQEGDFDKYLKEHLSRSVLINMSESKLKDEIIQNLKARSAELLDVLKKMKADPIKTVVDDMATWNFNDGTGRTMFIVMENGKAYLSWLSGPDLMTTETTKAPEQAVSELEDIESELPGLGPEPPSDPGPESLPGLEPEPSSDSDTKIEGDSSNLGTFSFFVGISK